MKILYFICTICCTFFLTGCFSSNVYDPPKAADKAFKKIVTAIDKKDTEALRDLFSDNAQSSSQTLESDIDKLIHMFDGEIVNYYSAGGENTSRGADHGKIFETVKSSYIVETNNQKFHIAVKYCTIDTFDRKNIGINSINIINDTDFQVPYVYRGDGQWSPGITFDTNSYKD